MRAPDPRARLTGILESISMLMSRHLRGTVERSLEVFIHLFERVSHPHHSGDATFVLMLHVNEEAFDDIEGRSQASAMVLLFGVTAVVFLLCRPPGNDGDTGAGPGKRIPHPDPICSIHRWGDCCC